MILTDIYVYWLIFTDIYWSLLILIDIHWYCLILADIYWYWMVLADIYWYWMILAGLWLILAGLWLIMADIGWIVADIGRYWLDCGWYWLILADIGWIVADIGWYWLGCGWYWLGWRSQIAHSHQANSSGTAAGKKRGRMMNERKTEFSEPCLSGSNQHERLQLNSPPVSNKHAREEFVHFYHDADAMNRSHNFFSDRECCLKR